MIDSLFAFMHSQPVMTFFLVLSLGYLVGRIEVAGISLGPAGGVLLLTIYFGYMYAAAVTLVKKGLAYVDDQTQEEISEQRGTITEPMASSRAISMRRERGAEMLDLLRIDSIDQADRFVEFRHAVPDRDQTREPVTFSV